MEDDRMRTATLHVTILLALLAAAGPARAGTLDQQQHGTSGGLTGIHAPDPFISESVAQTFTPEVGGGLDRVDLVVTRTHPQTALPLTIEIRSVDPSGAPGALVLAGTSVPAADVPADRDSKAFVPVTFAAPAPVQAGTLYAIVAHTADAERYGWVRGAGSEQYANGSA
jgi:hypothetical protein